MQLQAVKVNQLSAKMKSKKEIYNLLLQDGHAYMTPIHSTNVYFLKLVMKGDKEVIQFLPVSNDIIVHSSRQDFGCSCPVD